MKILITGATGFVGTTLVPFLIRKGYADVCLLVRDINKAQSKFANINVDFISTKEVEWEQKIIDYDPAVVLHMATYFTGRNDMNSADEIITSNILLTTHLLIALTKTRCKHFINIGTFTEYFYGDGQYNANNLYSASKTAVRPIIKFYQSLSQWNWINVIIYSPYGRFNANKKVIDYLLEAIDSPNKIDFSRGEQILDFIHVDDIADFFTSLFGKLDGLKDSFYEFHLGTGEGHSIREIANIIEFDFNKQVNANWGGREYNPSDPMYAVAPISKTISLLQWKAKISIKDGIKILLEDVGKV